MSPSQALTAATADAAPSSSIKSKTLFADLTDFTANSAERVRLHITPLTPELLNTYIPPSLQRQVSNISYHTVQTFPEGSFGFVELPAMEANKLKKKLNGSILKGAKVQIEEAKPEKRKKKREAEGVKTNGVDDEEPERPKKKSKKRKEEQGVLDGIELPGERKVRRGWTEPVKPRERKEKKAKKDRKEDSSKNKEKKLQEKSQFTKEPELLFRTKLPLNADPVGGKAKKKKSKKLDKLKSSDRDVVVHEFEKTRKHATFLRESGSKKNAKPATEYVEGKGWVDKDGDVVEDEKKNRRQERERVDGTTLDAPNGKHKEPRKLFKSAKSADAVSNGEDGTKAVRSKEAKWTPTPFPELSDSEENDSSVVSSSSSAVSSSDSSIEFNASAPSSPVSTPKPSSILTFAPIITTTDPTPPTTATTPSAVHPLEELFKRPKTPSGKPTKLAPIKTSFSFFGSGDGDDNDESDAEMADGDDADHLDINPPHTPFTRQDLEWRGLRSAAPTPDTAAIGKKLRVPWRDPSAEEDDASPSARDASIPENLEDDNMEDDFDGYAEATLLGKRGKTAESEFARKFWENRAVTNKAWKDRRREAKKEKRRREDRKIGKR